jgi:Poly(A) polymerase catalytic subunit
MSRKHKRRHDDDNDNKSYDEKELEILREAVDLMEKRKGEKIIQDPKVKNIISTVEEFIARKKLVCYGGTAINNILPEDAQFYNKDIELPDYDFYSDNALDDAKELADIYYKAGYEDVEAKSGVHHGTYKVFVNFTGIADITQMDPALFKTISRDSIVKKGIRYAPPDFLRMAMYLELSRPDGDVSRWEKVQKRLTLLNTHYPLKGYQCDKIEYQRGFEGATKANTGEVSISRKRSRSVSASASKSRSRSASMTVKKGGGGGGGATRSVKALKRKAISGIIRKYHHLGSYMKRLYHTVPSHEETIGDFKYTIEEDKLTHRYRLMATYERLLGADDTFVLYSMKESDIDASPADADADASKSESESKSRSPSPSPNRSKSPEYSVNKSNVSYSSNREKELAETDIYNIVRDVFIKNRAVFFGGYANILYSRYMPKHQRRIVQKIPDFDILSEEPRELCEAVVRELTAHKYTGVKYTKHAGVGEVISEHYDIRIGDDVIAFLYKPLACHSYNTIRVNGDGGSGGSGGGGGGDSIRIATIDTMLSFYLAFIYADRIYYDINRIMCMSQFLFDVQQHNRLKQSGLLRRFSINCYGKQPTLESMRFEKTEKYEELKGKRDSREFEEWFLRYIPYEHASAGAKASAKATGASAKKTRKKARSD